MSSIQGKHACRDKAVDMKMIDECLAPGMKNRQQTRFPGKMPLRVGGKGKHGISYRREQTGEQISSVEQYQFIEVMRYGEDHMEIATGQKLLPAFFQPLFFGHGLAFRAVPVSAGIVTVPEMAAPVTDLLVPAKQSCPAGPDCRHDLALIGSHGMGFPVFVTIFTEDVGQFVFRFHGRSSFIKESRGLVTFSSISGEACR
jgi:hypothetical protein